MAKTIEVKDMDDKTLLAKVGDARAELFSLKMQKAAMMGLEKPHEIKVLQKRIAQLLTEKNSRK